ncbi:ribonuclease J [Parabacteroides sp. PFB2-10]|uniref:MBL fold metallo-hydrolase n=1 Tax=Parabacteroides sp. PFB2-10 TaxID=1742405 RepID=UPI002476D09A|nr:MBL fold metallo-hydrolase [Parabacteroides sp. PFB2-10]MDH6312263.1 ribonuclease J [Parabacteroides sp. PFB2-10]
MKITIHRGTSQIGGCITEIESNGYKVFIDFGEQLPGAKIEKTQPIDGLTCGDVSKSALFITHYHGDHIGKIDEAIADLPIFVGKTAIEIYKCLENRLSYIKDSNEAEKHKRIVERIKTINAFEALQQVTIGKITITPLFVDHSAFDAYMFIVEADGKRVLHTGDFRGHGFRSKGLLPMLKRFAKNIDYIISEGSNVQRPKAAIQSEQDLQKEFETLFREKKYNFVLVSSTNIDRIFALYHAAKNAERCFVCDTYQAKIMKIVSENHKQYTSFYNIDYDQDTNPAGRFIDLDRRGKRQYSFKGKLKPYLEDHGFCMLIRANETFKPLLDEYAPSPKTKVYYSMWKGYLDNKLPASNKSLSDFLQSYKLEYKHTSGHTNIETLKVVFETVTPKEGIIPIHTEAPEKFQELFSEQTIIPLRDGEILECNPQKQ